VSVEIVSGSVVSHGRPWVGMPCDDLDIPQVGSASFRARTRLWLPRVRRGACVPPFAQPGDRMVGDLKCVHCGTTTRHAIAN
jgi:hypothetical protein